MSIAKVALIGNSPFVRESIKRMLGEADFEAVSINPEEINLPEILRHGYDIVIASSDFASNVGEEAFFNFLLSVKGFLLVNNNNLSSLHYISERTCAEEIISRIGNIIYSQHTARMLPARSSQRITVNLDVLYRSGDRSFRSIIQTLSTNGVFISSLNPLPKDSPVSLSFTLPDSTEPITANGKVLYSIGYDLDRGIIHHHGAGNRKVVAHPGMAILIEEIDEEKREAIKTFIDNKTI